MAVPDNAQFGKTWPHHSLLGLFTVLWGANFILAEVALREMSPISFSVSRFAVGGIALVIVLYIHNVRRRGETDAARTLFPRLSREDLPRLLLVSILGAALAPWLGIEGLDQTDGARASLWLALGPIVSSGIGYAARTEKLGLAGYLGALLAGLGTVVLAVDGIRPAHGYWFGDLLLILSLLLVVLEFHLIKPLVHRYGATAMVTSRTLIGGMIYIVIASTSLAQETWFDFSGWTWIAILAGGAIGVGIGQWVKVRALKCLGPTRVVFYGNLVPIAAFLIAWLALGESPSLFEVVAALLILSGAVCLQIVDPASSGSAMVEESTHIDA